MNKLVERPHTKALWDRLGSCAAHLGRELADAEPGRLTKRLHESDAELLAHGLLSGLLTIDGNYLRTVDPHQGTAWLVEGAPCHPCWEYIPHAASYVELITRLGYPAGSVRFETPDAELNLDLAVLDPDGHVVVLGEVKREPRQIESLAQRIPAFDGDPGKALPVRRGGPQGPRREAWKLAHQLWVTRAPWLWLVASGTRLAYPVDYSDGLALGEPQQLPNAAAFCGLATDWPRLKPRA